MSTTSEETTSSRQLSQLLRKLLRLMSMKNFRNSLLLLKYAPVSPLTLISHLEPMTSLHERIKSAINSSESMTSRLSLSTEARSESTLPSLVIRISFLHIASIFAVSSEDFPSHLFSRRISLSTPQAAEIPVTAYLTILSLYLMYSAANSFSKNSFIFSS